MITDKVIDAEFDKDDCGPFDSPISAYKSGFRTAERIAKIEVLEEIASAYYKTSSEIAAFNLAIIMLDELKAGN